jgi:predicted Fe-Mo cluster-binding NifX family protein
VEKVKVAVSARKPELEAEIDPRFGRARWLVIYDSDSGEWEAFDNSENCNAVQGAGIKAAELVSEKGCQAVITGHLGPKAFNVLEHAGVKGYLKPTGSVNDAIEDFLHGKLNETTGADTKGHW